MYICSMQFLTSISLGSSSGAEEGTLWGAHSSMGFPAGVYVIVCICVSLYDALRVHAK